MIKVFFVSNWSSWRGKKYYDQLIHVFHVMYLKGVTMWGEKPIIEFHVTILNYEMIIALYPAGKP